MFKTRTGTTPHPHRERTARFRGTKVALKTKGSLLFPMHKPKNQSSRGSPAPQSRTAAWERSASRRVRLAREKRAPTRSPSRGGASPAEGSEPPATKEDSGSGVGEFSFSQRRTPPPQPLLHSRRQPAGPLPADAPGWPGPHRSHLPAPALPPAPSARAALT